MGKRGRDGEAEAEAEAVRHAIELVCQRTVNIGEMRMAALTPLEKQVVRLKESLPHDVVLMVACGYRVKFYGRDSRVASRRLGIMCIATTPFESSSVPYVRVNLYVHRLVAMGYRVALADQENASIRATSGNVKGIFTREVSRVYSRGTLLPSEVIGTTSSTSNSNALTVPTVDQVDVTEGGEEDEETEPDGVVPPLKEGASELFMCFVRSLSSGTATMEMTLVSFVTYDVVRYHITCETELLDILYRYNIVELVIFQDTKEEDASLLLLSKTSLSPLRYLPEMYASSLNAVLPLHFGPTCNGEEDDCSVSVSVFPYAGSMDETIARFLVPYQLNRVYEKMCTGDGKALPRCGAVDIMKNTMELPGSTLSALDVFHSSIGVKGSLMALIDHSLTLPGVRRLRTWLSNPLCDIGAIVSRRDAVSFLVRGEEGNAVANLLRECAKFGDIEATLGKIRAQRCTVPEYLSLLRAVGAVHTLANSILSHHSEKINCLIREVLLSVTSAETSAFLCSCQCEVESQATSPLEYFEAFGVSIPANMQTHLTARDEALRALDEELEHIRQTLCMPELEYRTIAGTPFIVDLPQAKCNRVPKDWLVLTRTKSHVRFHTLNIVNLNVTLCSSRERLLIAANNAWQKKQEQLVGLTSTLSVFQAVIDAVAVLDVLHCLAVTSAAPGYVAPEFTADTECLTIVDGRHPVLDKIMRNGYVSCGVRLVKGGAWILTGPNMGGKSALMRMVGTFVIMAQLGCYVPATAAQLPVFTAVYCRMGASDSLLEGTSTFLKEMEETSRILCSPRLSSSLVLLDELGRGTSSFDGISVAAATLEYLLQQGATTLFVTHYSHLCEPYLNASPGDRVSCYYMGFHEKKTESMDGISRLVFTYKPTPGVTPSSFGVRVAQMVGLPTNVVAEAQQLSAKQEREHMTRMALMQLCRFTNTSFFPSSREEEGEMGDT